MSSFQNKLYNYEQTPPEKLWDQIAAALDESHIADEFPSKLYNAEAIPPADAWDKIASSINTNDPEVLRFSQKRLAIFRYAAAAVIIGFVTFAVIKLTGKSKSNSNNPDTATAKKSDTSNKKGITPTNSNLPTNIAGQTPAIDQEDENTASIAATERPRTPTKKVKARYAVSDNIDAAEPIYAINDAPNLADRYIMLMTPNGVIRMSKKWGSLVCCVSGQEQDEGCKDQIKKWQEKLACSPVTSTGNFIDILSLVSSLDSEL